MKLFNIPTSMFKPTLALLTLALALGCSHLVSRADSDHGHTPSHDMGDSHGAGESHSNESHHHSTLEIPAGQPVPTVTLMIYPDPEQGWNLEVLTTHFSFAPEQVNLANSPGSGHAHLYINGEKISRLYGPWLHLPELPSGQTEITVGLNANGHEALTHNGQKIEATIVVEVP
ncbi:hypothetical protein IQ254_06220 [Nodosilinea sp. LEGE 07088]|uniref:hypothetical protein n=1 Tax=Nodosilinea sp. LEGE 07088 TaxID=2777968 RepID=UPI00187EDA48|nr:hypothetical protein [Nodosilinea sp. LEGE 07088]MBE9136803.1 hypothetical protein [Nodosilinea sp. LEGE 07088]